MNDELIERSVERLEMAAQRMGEAASMMAQAVEAQARIGGMTALNLMRERAGNQIAYDESAFADVERTLEKARSELGMP